MKHEIALIGCGRIGFLLEKDPLRNKPCTHFGGAKAAGLRITCACDTDPERLAMFGAAAGLPGNRLFPDARTLLDTVHPRCVIIATHTETHVPLAMMATRAGAEIIVLEKPIAPSLVQASHLLRMCEKNGTRLIVNHERRYDPRYLKARDLVTGGAIGTVKTIHGSMLTGPYRGSSLPGEGGGPLLHDGTHLVDMVRFFAGDVISIRGRFQRDRRTGGFEDRAVAWLTTGGGVDVFLEAGGSRRYFVFELEISGTEGKLVIGNGYQKLYRSRKSSFYKGFRDLAEVSFPRYRAGNCFTSLYREVRSLLSGRQVQVLSSGLDGYHSLEMIHGIYLSADRGRDVTLPLNPRQVRIDEIFGLQARRPGGEIT